MKKIIPITLLILLSICVGAIAGMYYYYSISQIELSREEYKYRIKYELCLHRDGNKSIIDMKDIATFPWDKLYFFEAYTSTLNIEKLIGIDIFGEIHSISDGEQILVFVEYNNDYKYLIFYKNIIDFTELINDEGYSRENAIFIVDDNGDAKCNKC